MVVPNKSWVFKQPPKGAPVAGQDITTEDRPIDIETPPKGGLVLEVRYASFDPYLRGRMRDPNAKSNSTMAALSPGETIVNSVLASVYKSDSPDFAVGDKVLAFAGIAEYVRVDDPAAAGVRKVVNPYGLDEGLYLGPLGMPGRTAWSGFHRIGQPKEGETLFVSSAAGAVGQVVGQIAKREGLKVIGSVGSDEKLDFILNELGFDAGFNYKKEAPGDAVPRLAPDGVDIYFDNVGGDHLEAALANMKVGGRIPLCGMISGYNKTEQEGIKNIMRMVYYQVTMEGFLQGNPKFGPAYDKEHQEKMQKWLAEGSFKAKLYVTEGIEHASEGFIGMLEGKNFGKAVLKIR